MISFENNILRLIRAWAIIWKLTRMLSEKRKNNDTWETIGMPIITSYVKGQRNLWFGHKMRRLDSVNTKAAIEWSLSEKWPRGRIMKWRLNREKLYLEKLEIENGKTECSIVKRRRQQQGDGKNCYRIVKPGKRRKIYAVWNSGILTSWTWLL